MATARVVFPGDRSSVRAFARERAFDFMRRRLLGLPLEPAAPSGVVSLSTAASEEQREHLEHEPVVGRHELPVDADGLNTITRKSASEEHARRQDREAPAAPDE